MTQAISQGKNKGRLGVFWHTQGSGKTESMIFFSQKILRKIPGNWTFVVVTDRNELDEQTYKRFVRSGVIQGKQEWAETRYFVETRGEYKGSGMSVYAYQN